MIDSKLLEVCWTDFCQAINAYVLAQRNGTAPATLQPLVLDQKGQKVTVTHCNPDGTCMCLEGTREVNIVLTTEYIHQLYIGLFKPLGFGFATGAGR